MLTSLLAKGIQKDQTRYTPVLPLPDPADIIQPLLRTRGEDLPGIQLSSQGIENTRVRKSYIYITIVLQLAIK